MGRVGWRRVRGTRRYGAQAKGERRHMQFDHQNLDVSSFYASWGETLETLWRGALLEAAPQGLRWPPPSPSRAGCNALNGKPPHIILIHQELVVQPSLFKQLSYDHTVDSMFLSADRNLHHARRDLRRAHPG